mmetsp:Transcript_6146/g.17625  ORF Transcript_6146/g.17625 Transcript_6146/m.17625 type:complete len:202 (-) Transcript_6146:960-1565(-)
MSWHSGRCQGEAGSDVHGLQFLEQQLARVRQLHSRHVIRGFGGWAHGLSARLVPVPQQPAVLADMHLKGVGGDHQPLQQQHASTVPDEAVSLHLTKTQAALPGAPLRGLPSQHHPWAAGARVNLVQHHVLQLLVVHGPHEHVSLQRLPSDAGSEEVLAAVAEAAGHQVRGDVVYLVRQPPRLPERGAAPDAPHQHSRLARK